MELTCTAVDHHGTTVRAVVGAHSLDEGQHGSGVLGHAVVRPRGEVELTYLSRLFAAANLRGEGGGGGVNYCSIRCRSYS